MRHALIDAIRLAWRTFTCSRGYHDYEYQATVPHGVILECTYCGHEKITPNPTWVVYRPSHSEEQ